MDANLIYAKTPTGDEAVRQSTRVVQRNLRMVLVQVDGKMSVQELSVKIGNPRLVEAALRELEEGGFIVPSMEAASVWEESTRAAQQAPRDEPLQPMSQFSVFGPKTGGHPESRGATSAASNFSSFGKPILPTRGNVPGSGFKPSMMPPPYVSSAPTMVTEEIRPARITGRKVLLGLLGVLVLVGVAAIVYPYDRFKPGIEAAATKFVGSPVSVGSVGLTLYPMPHLTLKGVVVGASGTGRIAEVRVASPLSLLGGGPVDISRVDVTGASLSAKQLVAMPFFRTDGTRSPGVLVRKVHVEHSQLVLAESVVFEDIYGEASFRADGSLEKATFESDDRSLLIDAQASPLGIALKMEGRAWKPAGTTAVFASLQASGVLQADKLLVQNIDTTFLGGILRGNWLLDWGSGLTMVGDGTLSRIDMRKLGSTFAPVLKSEGEMSGTLKLRSTGGDWGSLWRNVEAVLSTEISRGTFYGADLGEAARRNGVSDVRGGATKFDWLRSTVRVTPKQVMSKDVRMDAGMVTAVGQFVAERDGLVEGNMAVTLQSSVSRTSVPVRIFGALPNLTAVGRK